MYMRDRILPTPLAGVDKKINTLWGGWGRECLSWTMNGDNWLWCHGLGGYLPLPLTLRYTNTRGYTDTRIQSTGAVAVSRLNVKLFPCLQYEQNKSYCEDLTEGKFSFPIIYAINNHPEDQQIMSEPNPRHLEYWNILHIILFPLLLLPSPPISFSTSPLYTPVYPCIPLYTPLYPTITHYKTI